MTGPGGASLPDLTRTARLARQLGEVREAQLDGAAGRNPRRELTVALTLNQPPGKALPRPLMTTLQNKGGRLLGSRTVTDPEAGILAQLILRLDGPACTRLCGRLLHLPEERGGSWRVVISVDAYTAKVDLDPREQNSETSPSTAEDREVQALMVLHPLPKESRAARLGEVATWASQSGCTVRSLPRPEQLDRQDSLLYLPLRGTPAALRAAAQHSETRSLAREARITLR